MIIGAHSILYSKDPDADRAVLRDVLKLPHVDVGGGWLIFGLPPAEVAVHPSDENDVHEFYLMCDDVETFIEAMAEHNLACDAPQTFDWGILTQVRLPGGGKLGVYQARHARPKPPSAKKGVRTPVPKRAAERPAKRGAAKRGPAKRKTAKRAPAKRPARAKAR
jgi:hypothetical protein